jgi:hypothetical protein
VLDAERLCIWWAAVELEEELECSQPRHRSLLERNPWHAAVNVEPANPALGTLHC